VLEGGQVRFPRAGAAIRTLSGLLHSAAPAEQVRALVDPSSPAVPLTGLTLLPPLDAQEVWRPG